MASLYLDHRSKSGPAMMRVKRGLSRVGAQSTFTGWVKRVAEQNGWTVLSMSPVDATLGEPAKGGAPIKVHAYLSVEMMSPPSAPEPHQPCRRALKKL